MNLETASGGGDAGETVRIESHTGNFLAWAACSPRSRIRARAWSFEPDQRIDAGEDGFIIGHLGDAPDHPMAIRFPEGEYLEGLIVVRL